MTLKKVPLNATTTTTCRYLTHMHTSKVKPAEPK